MYSIVKNIKFSRNEARFQYGKFELVSGLWHGASWHYVIWGALNGIYQILGEIFIPVKEQFCKILKVKKESIGHRIICILCTFVLICISWVFFRANGVGHALSIFKSIIHVYNPEILFDGSLFTVTISEKSFRVLGFSIIVLMIADMLKYKGICIRNVIVNQNIWIRWVIYLVCIMYILIFGIWGPAFNSSNFIYFQF